VRDDFVNFARQPANSKCNGLSMVTVNQHRRRPTMQRTLSWILLAWASASIAHADAPATGIVIEGASTPGITLGDERWQVDAGIGAPDFCQSVETAGDRASCNHPVAGGGTVNIRYRGTDGGNASNSPSDRVHAIRWYEAVSGWVTTAGIDTALAASDPDAVLEAYPEGELAFNMFGDLYRVRDAELGIEVTWVLDFYSGITHVNMAIFGAQTTPPPPPPPTETPSVHVADLDLSASKKKGQRSVRAVIQVRDDDGLAASNAAVTVAWTLPGGASFEVTESTSSGGYAVFEISSASRGDHLLDIMDVQLAGHEFDLDASTLSATVMVR
jgi:hypothetical protein